MPSFVVPFVVFLVLNVVENWFHYNIGQTDSKCAEPAFRVPSAAAALKMVAVMLMFAALQGGLTYLGES